MMQEWSQSRPPHSGATVGQHTGGGGEGAKGSTRCRVSQILPLSPSMPWESVVTEVVVGPLMTGTLPWSPIDTEVHACVAVVRRN